MLESEMFEKGFIFLQKKKEYKIVKQEIPFLSRCIDTVIIDNNDVIISIEFKVSKWRHAIEQAKNHKLGADKAYICLPKRRISETLMSALVEAGIGLLIFDPDISEKIYEAVPAPNQSENIPAFRKLLLDTVNKI